MLLQDKTLLRLHVEAVWGVTLTHIEQDHIMLTPESVSPSWKLCVAALANSHVFIWRPDVSEHEREALRVQARAALAFPSTSPPHTPGVHREVALSLTAAPRINEAIAHTLARPLTHKDEQQVKTFQASIADTDNYFDSAKRPLTGVFENARLVCIAHSSRRTREACELGVDTLPDARRKGYALAATHAWTESVLRESLVPLYSAFAENNASLRLADAAGYRVFAQVVTITL
jgi:RimJ/RimL family protein N-acetyltransferase